MFHTLFSINFCQFCIAHINNACAHLKKLASMTDDLMELNDLVSGMVVTQKVKQVKCKKVTSDPCPGEKRKVESSEELPLQTCCDSDVGSSNNGLCNDMDADLFETSSTSSTIDLEFHGLESYPVPHEDSCDNTLGVMPNLAEDEVSNFSIAQTKSSADPDVIKKFHECLAMLPLEVQSMFVDNLVSSVTT